MLAIEDGLRLPWWRLRLPGGLETTFANHVAPARARYIQPWLLIFVVFNLVSLKVDLDLFGEEAFRIPAHLTLFVFVPVAIAGILALGAWNATAIQVAVVAATAITDLVIVLNSARLAPLGHTDTYLILAAIVPLVVGLIAPLPFGATLGLCLACFGLYAGFIAVFDLVQDGKSGVAALVSLLILIPPKLSYMREREAKRSFLLGLRDQLNAAALKEANAQLTVLSERDALTGIANRRHFAAAFDREWRLACIQGTWLGVLLIDIDHFKRFNDSAGHAGGDRCLAAIAGALEMGIARSGGLIARYGGEEFVAVLPGLDPAATAGVAEHLRQAVVHLGLAHPGLSAGANVTVSIGIETRRGRTGAVAESGGVLATADAALYEAKAAGRNRVARIAASTPASRPVSAA
jgi:diguanylate cyclase (GGDEF)-like protein